jgi:hypothetical protein
VDKKSRALAKEGNDNGRKRFSLYKEAFKRINDSIDAGFYLEAISLIESLLSDRLESRLSFIRNQDVSFKTLGFLINEMSKSEMDESLLKMVKGKVDDWRVCRNKALHEMIKMESNQNISWEERISEVKNVAESGLIILRDVDKKCSDLRKI